MITLHDIGSQLWAMEPRALNSMLDGIAAMGPAALEGAARAVAARPELLERLGQRHGRQPLNLYRTAEDATEERLEGLDGEGTLTIPVHGPIMKQVPCMFDVMGVRATSSEYVRELLALAVESPEVERVVLDIDSPGGTVAGTQALAEDVFAVRSFKPITAQVSDMCGSAAYWIASQAESIDAEPGAMVGSIGTVATVIDSSRAAMDAGIKVHVVSSHELKGAFTEGAEITPSQLEDLQRTIDSFTSLFIEGVARGRDMPTDAVRECATGQVWIGAEAKDRGLVDAVRNVTPVTRTVDELPTLAPPAPAASVAVTNADAVRHKPENLSMENKEQLEAVARAEAAEARAKELEAQVAESFKASVETLIDANRDRVGPAQIGTVRDYAAAVKDLGKVKAFVEALPSAVHEEPLSATLEDAGADDAPEQLPRAQSDANRKCGISDSKFSAYRKVVGWRSDGRLELEDGRIVTKAELEGVA